MVPSTPAQRAARAQIVEPLARPPLSVGILLLDRFTLCEFGMFTDVLRWAADDGDRSRQVNVRWFVMSARTDPIQASCGVLVMPTAKLIDPQQLDYVVLLGGQLKPVLNVGEDVIKYLHAAAAAGVTLVGGSTAATFALVRAGLMNGRRCCVGWYHHQDFLDWFPGREVIADRLFLMDGDRITCPGASATADLAIHLVAEHLGQSLAQKASHFLLVDRARAGAEMQPHAPIASTALDVRIRRAVLLMEQHLSRPLPISSLARKLKLSRRQLERLFEQSVRCSPVAMYRSMRMRHAAWLLSNTKRSITDIALNAGYADCAHFSREFRRAYGTAPSRHRTTSLSRGGELAASRIFQQQLDRRPAPANP